MYWHLVLRNILIHYNHWRTLRAAFVVGSCGRGTCRIMRSRSVSTLNLNIHAVKSFHHPTFLAYKTPLRLLVRHLAIVPSLSQHLVIPQYFTASLTLDAFSSCLRNRSPTNVVELLEQGRTVFWSQLTAPIPCLTILSHLTRPERH